MKKTVKILLLIIGVILLFLVVINLPIYRKPYIELENSTLLRINRLIGLTGEIEVIKIYKDGSVEDSRVPDNVSIRLSDEQLHYLTNFINSKQYRLYRESLYKKWGMWGVMDYGYTKYLIKVGDKTLRIHGDKILYDNVIKELDQGV